GIAVLVGGEDILGSRIDGGKHRPQLGCNTLDRFGAQFVRPVPGNADAQGQARFRGMNYRHRTSPAIAGGRGHRMWEKTCPGRVKRTRSASDTMIRDPGATCSVGRGPWVPALARATCVRNIPGERSLGRDTFATIYCSG